MFILHGVLQLSVAPQCPCLPCPSLHSVRHDGYVRQPEQAPSQTLQTFKALTQQEKAQTSPPPPPSPPSLKKETP